MTKRFAGPSHSVAIAITTLDRCYLRNNISLFRRPTLNTLLHARQGLTAVENKLMLLALHEFILKFKRFQINQQSEEISEEF